MILFDTSVLVAAMISSHCFHAASLKSLQEVCGKKIRGGICIHSLAECYAVLTAYPVEPRILPATAEKLISENLLAHFQVVEFSVKDYFAAIQRVKNHQLRSGAIYDALILQAALKKKAEFLCTWNLSDFTRLAGKEIEVCEPE